MNQVDDRRWVIVDDGDAFGPYSERELRTAMLEDLCDPEISTPLERIEYQAMTTQSLMQEYVGINDTQIIHISEPTPEWRQEVANG